MKFKIEIRDNKGNLLDKWISHAPNEQAAKEEAANKRNKCFSQAGYKVTEQS